ncbi:thioredoxin [Saccharospirillum sp. MSK14-1]|uniref:DsbA family protein n=1 Tax=Saccharospirillum sp. MSK14-1 TaxID=1897632 RepID=UPI000D3546AE|nr:thioredoxin [Saccharospirillum sp. MSK14-1]PTY37929.1 thioredoxin [Saccharospirillum sp. MSK14-1]
MVHGAPLIWGSGARLFEVFLEPTCPFSVKAFNKLDALLNAAGADQIRIQIWLHSQPWHLYSGVIVRCILAASTLENGRDKAKAVMQAVADHREAFEFDNHCTGPNRDATPNDIILRIEQYSGVKLTAAFEQVELDKLIKHHGKYARQNGIHVSPTFMVDGLVQPSLGSGDAVEDWANQLLS